MMHKNIRGEMTKAQLADRRGSAPGTVIQPEITLLEGYCQVYYGMLHLSDRQVQ